MKKLVPSASKHVQVLSESDLVLQAASVLSGERQFLEMIHPILRKNHSLKTLVSLSLRNIEEARLNRSLTYS